MKQILTIQDLRQAAREKRSVVVPNGFRFKRRTPAAWVMNQIGTVLCMLFDSGIYIYEPAGPPRKFSDRKKKAKPQQTEPKLLTYQ